MPEACNSRSLIVVGARLNSSRLPRKHLLDLAGAPLIARIFERLAKTGAQVVLATTNDAFNQDLVAWAQEANVPVFAFDGDVDDVVGRVDAVVHQYQADQVIYVCGDCPLVSQDYIRMALEALKANPDWQQVVPEPGPQGDSVIHEGILCLSRAGWTELVARSQSALQREHVGLALTQGAPLSQGTIRDAAEFYGPGFRMSVDTAADWRFMAQLYRHWYTHHEGPVSLAWALEQLKTTDIGEINRHVMQKSGYRRYGRALFVTEAGAAKGLGQLVRTVRLAERVCELAGLGVSVWILGEPDELGCLRTVNHEWIASEDELVQRLEAEQLPSLIVADLFPDRLQRPAVLREVLADLVARGIQVVGLDRLWLWHRALSQVVVPCLVYRGEDAANVVSGPAYALAPTWPLPDMQPADSKSVLTVMTGGSDAIRYGNYLPTLLDHGLPEGTIVKWLQGPFAIAPRLPSQPRLKWQVVGPQSDIAELAQASTVVLSVYGNTVLELLANRIPLAVLPAPGLVEDAEWELIKQQDGLFTIEATAAGVQGLARLLSSEPHRRALLERAERLGAATGLQRAAERILTTLDAVDGDAVKGH